MIVSLIETQTSAIRLRKVKTQFLYSRILQSSLKSTLAHLKIIFSSQHQIKWTCQLIKNIFIPSGGFHPSSEEVSVKTTRRLQRIQAKTEHFFRVLSTTGLSSSSGLSKLRCSRGMQDQVCSDLQRTPGQALIDKKERTCREVLKKM